MIEEKTQFEKDIEKYTAYKGILTEPEKDIMCVIHFNMADSLKRIADSLEIIASKPDNRIFEEQKDEEDEKVSQLNEVSRYDKDYQSLIAYQGKEAEKWTESAWPLFQIVIHYTRHKSLKRVADSLEKLISKN